MKPSDVENLIILGTHFYAESDKSKIDDSDIRKFNDLGKSLTTQLKTIRNDKDILKVLERGYKLMDSASKGKEIVCNAFILSIGCIQLLLEEEVFRGSNKMKINRLCWELYNKIESSQQLDDSFRNANNVVTKIYKEIK